MADPRPTHDLPATSPERFDPLRRPAPDGFPVIPGFEIVAPVGRGGMGAVFLARQTVLNRVVALKTIHTEVWPDGSDRARFLAEAEAVAAVDHPNVIRMYEYGEAADRPYFAMEYVPGGSLAARLADAGSLPPREAAAVVAGVARGVQAVHDVGVVHRDLKPGNILLQSGEGGPRGGDSKTQTASVSDTVLTESASRSRPPAVVPKVTDFGLAKKLANKQMTSSGLIVGTPVYMAPEQAAGRGRFVGPPADIYALGVVLYESLTGQVPFDSDDTPELLRMLREQEPAPVRTHRPDVPADLDLICLKCLEKDPRRRYPSAAALADDLQRFLDGEPVTVRPAGRVEKTARWVRRYPTRAALYGVTAVAVVSVVLTTAAVHLLRQTRDANHGLEVALGHVEEARQEKADALVKEQAAHKKAGDALAEKSAALAAEVKARRERDAAAAKLLAVAAARAVDLAHREVTAHNAPRAREVLDAVPADRRGWEWGYVDRLCRQEVRAADLRDAMAAGAVLHPGGRLAVAGRAGAGFWPFPDLGAVRRFNDPATAVALSADGKRAAVATADGKGFRVFDTATWRAVAEFPHPTRSVRLSADGSRAVAVVAEPQVRAAAWDVAARRELRLNLTGHVPVAADISPDGTWAAVAGAVDGRAALVGSLVVVDLTTGAPRAAPQVPSAGAVSVAFNPSGSEIATGWSDGVVRVWDRQSGDLLASARGHAGDVRAVAWSRDGKRLVSGGADRTVRVWAAAGGAPLAVWDGHAGPVVGVGVAAGGEAVSVGEDGTLKVFPATAPPAWVKLAGWPGGDAVPLALDPTGGRVVTGGAATVWDTQTGAAVVRLGDASAKAVGFSADGGRVWTCTKEGVVREWDAATGAPVGTRAVPHGGDIAAVTPGFTRSVARTPEGCVRVLDGATGAVVAEADAARGLSAAVAVSHGGVFVAAGGDDRLVRVWDAATGAVIAEWGGHAGAVRAAAFSPDGARLATADAGAVKVWDAAAGVDALTLPPPPPEGGRNPAFAGVGWSGDGTRLAALTADGRLRVFAGEK